jgi:hypothetical protein
MITELTKKQEKSIILFREKWRKIGLCTKEVDKKMAIKAITKLYKHLNKKRPLFVFCPSPLFCVWQINFFKFLNKDWRKLISQEKNISNLEVNLEDNLGVNLWDNLDANLRESLGENLRENLWANLWENLGENLRANLRANLEENLRESLGENLRANLRENLQENLRANLGANLWENLGENLWANLRVNLGANLWVNLRENLRANLGANLRANLGENLQENLRANLWENLQANLGANLEGNLRANLKNQKVNGDLIKEFNENHLFWAYGQMDSSWICFYKFMETIGIEYNNKDSELLELWAQTAKSCSWFWTFENIVFVSDRPQKLSFDDRYRLHDEHGPAYRYSDGWEGYYLHGVHFSKELYLKVISREMEVKEILKIKDIDQRVQAMKFAKSGLRDFYKSEKGKRIDSLVKLDKKGRPVKYELWKIPAGNTFTKEAYFAIYNCPSAIERGEEREYTKGVPPVKTVGEAMAWGMSDDNFTLSEESWRKLIPLKHES